jgi:hypothetical protein
VKLRKGKILVVGTSVGPYIDRGIVAFEDIKDGMGPAIGKEVAVQEERVKRVRCDWGGTGRSLRVNDQSQRCVQVRFAVDINMANRLAIVDDRDARVALGTALNWLFSRAGGDD